MTIHYESVPQSNIHFQPFCLTCREVAKAKCYNENHPQRVGPEVPRLFREWDNVIMDSDDAGSRK